MGKPSVRLRAVPVLHIGWDHNDRPWRQANSGFAFFLIPAAARRADQDLPAAGSRVMNMPVVAAARFKGHVCQKEAGFSRINQRI